MTIEVLLEIVSPKDLATGRGRRVEQTALFELLERQRGDADLALYGSAHRSGSLMIHSILVLIGELGDTDPESLMNWSGNPFGSPSCGLVWGGGKLANSLSDFPHSNGIVCGAGIAQ